MGDETVSYLAALDVGTTTLRCQIINSSAETVSSACTGVNLVYPQPGFVEIEPDDLWRNIVAVIKQAIENANLQTSDIKGLGISTQRSTFITWQKDTSKPFHNFVTWKDMRSKAFTKSWNESLIFKGFRTSAYMIYLLTRNKRYLMGSALNITTTHCTGRLAWLIENNPDLRENLRKKNVCFATVDTWILHKLTGGKTYVTDVTNASSTGLYDPFIMNWSSWPKSLLKLPTDIYPEVVNNDYDFGVTDFEIFNSSIPIKCVMADQQASMFGSCCFEKDDLKVTLGTGSFLDMNTGGSAHGSLDGIYPLVAWKFENDVDYIAEAACNDSGSLIEWALNVGLVTTPQETSSLALKVEDNDGVHFIPAFSGLGPPICDDKAASGFFGVKPTSTKEHMVRAILESIAYRVILAYKVLKTETRARYQRICVDGGVSKNDFICQLLADMSGLEVVRSTTSEMSVLGVAFVAGLNLGIWKSKDELTNLRKIDKIFKPECDPLASKILLANLSQWMDVVERFRSWY